MRQPLFSPLQQRIVDAGWHDVVPMARSITLQREPNNRFEGAAFRLLLRYYARWPMTGRGLDIDSVIYRWHRRRSYEAVRRLANRPT